MPPFQRRERTLVALVTVAVLTAMALFVASPGINQASAIFFLLTFAAGACLALGKLRGGRAVTDAQIRANVLAEARQALADTGRWRAWRKRTTRGGWVGGAELDAIAAYLTDTLTDRKDQA